MHLQRMHVNMYARGTAVWLSLSHLESAKKIPTN